MILQVGFSLAFADQRLFLSRPLQNGRAPGALARDVLFLGSAENLAEPRRTVLDDGARFRPNGERRMLAGILVGAALLAVSRPAQGAQIRLAIDRIIRILDIIEK